jgi:hypothetical protein
MRRESKVSPMSHYQMVESVSRLLRDHDTEGLIQLVHDDFVFETPQSGERIVGIANNRAVIENYPGEIRSSNRKVHGSTDAWVSSPSFTLLRINGSGDEYTTEEWVEYPNGERGYGIALYKFRGDRIAKVTFYFAAPFAAPAWRAPWVEMMPELGPKTTR